MIVALSISQILYGFVLVSSAASDNKFDETAKLHPSQYEYMPDSSTTHKLLWKIVRE